MNKIIGALLALFMLSSPALAQEIRPPLPADVAINRDAGRGNRLIVTLRLDGQDVPVFVDTGASETMLDKCLEPRLGPRLGIAVASHFGAKHKINIYKAPKIYLGGVPLKTGGVVMTGSFKMLSWISGRPLRGMLGMDCLRHYCIQFDFEAGKMRFLDPGHLDTAALGKAYPIAPFGPTGRPFIHQPGVIEGQNTNALVDTGFKIDGVVERRAAKEHRAGSFLTAIRNFWICDVVSKWGGVLRPGTVRLAAHYPDCTWNGEPYTDLKVGVDKEMDIIGLRFLARHLVTLDFPHGVLYLKQTSVGPLK